jgi:membrane protein implicated in regulation of membrane protease activity
MGIGRWPARAVVRYVLFQIPNYALLILIWILLRHWWDPPGWVLWSLVLFWVAKDAFWFFFVWRAYDTSPVGQKNTMIGKEGLVEVRLAPSGYVRIQGEIWRAELQIEGQSLEKGRTIRVRAVRGLTLIVEPDRTDKNS